MLPDIEGVANNNDMGNFKVKSISQKSKDRFEKEGGHLRGLLRVS